MHDFEMGLSPRTRIYRSPGGLGGSLVGSFVDAYQVHTYIIVDSLLRAYLYVCMGDGMPMTTARSTDKYLNLDVGDVGVNVALRVSEALFFPLLSHGPPRQMV